MPTDHQGFVTKIIKHPRVSLVIVSVIVTFTILFRGGPPHQDQLDEHIVNDISQLNPVTVARVMQPHSVDEIVSAIERVSLMLRRSSVKRFSFTGQPLPVARDSHAVLVRDLRARSRFQYKCDRRAALMFV